MLNGKEKKDAIQRHEEKRDERKEGSAKAEAEEEGQEVDGRKEDPGKVEEHCQQGGQLYEANHAKAPV